VKLEIGKEIRRTKGAAVERLPLFGWPKLRAPSLVLGSAPAQNWIINDSFPPPLL
jgi:hypothetical protein